MLPGDNDTELLDRLADALALPEIEPSPEGLDALRRAVAGHSNDRARSRRPALQWWRRRWALAGLATTGVVVSAGTAFAAGAPLPEPLRALASEVGLPVASPQLARVQQAESVLAQDLHSNNTRPTTVAHDTEVLASDLDHLNPSDRAKAGSVPTRLFQQACRFQLSHEDTAASGRASAGGNGSVTCTYGDGQTPLGAPGGGETNRQGSIPGTGGSPGASTGGFHQPGMGGNRPPNPGSGGTSNPGSGGNRPPNPGSGGISNPGSGGNRPSNPGSAREGSSPVNTEPGTPIDFSDGLRMTRPVPSS